MQVAEDAVAGLAAGIRIPKAESPDDVQWVHRRAPGTPLICAIESARGLLAAQEIAAWAQTVLEAFAAAGGNAVKLPDGEFVDLPVADRARRLLEFAGRRLACTPDGVAPSPLLYAHSRQMLADDGTFRVS